MKAINPIARDFSHAASHYDDYANLQRQAVDKLSEWLPDTRNLDVLDAGMGTGYAMRNGWLGIDIAEGMCQQVHNAICADMQFMPFKNESFDIIFSSLAMQWLEDNSRFFMEASRCLKPGGRLLIASLGKKTLTELRQSFNTSEIFAPILPFDELSLLEKQCATNGFIIRKANQVTLTTRHQNVHSLLRHLKGLGARYKVTAQKSLHGKSWLHKLEQHYPRAEEAVQASWEVIYLMAVKA